MGKSDWTVKMNHAGCRDVRNSSGVCEYLLKRAEAIRRQAESMSMSGARYDADVRPGVTRAHAMVKTTDIVSMLSNQKHNALVKSMDAGRD